MYISFVYISEQIFFDVHEDKGNKLNVCGKYTRLY